MKNFTGDIEFFSRKLAGELSTDEVHEFALWLSESPANQEEFSSFEKVWNGVDVIQGKKSVDVDAAWNRFVHEVQDTKAKSFNFKPLLAIAAILTICLMTWFGYKLYTKRIIENFHVSTASAMHKNIVLPDKSEIALNQNSSINYPKEFGDERRIQLHGEAFFEVTKNPQKPFIVEVNNVRIQVVGTSFLVTEHTDKSVTVVVRTGKVAVYTEGTNDTVFLTPGERTDVNKTNQLKTINTQKNYISWKTKTFEFENETLEQVVSQINAAYFSDIQIEGNELKQCRISLQFSNKTIDEIIEIIEMTLDIKVSKTNNSIILSGKGC